MEASGVPIVVAIDEQGIVRAVNPRVGDFEESFLRPSSGRGDLPGKSTGNDRPTAPDLANLQSQAVKGRMADAWRRYADAVSLWGGPARATDAIAAYESALELAPNDPRLWFRLGVNLRARHETSARRPGDFAGAVNAWEKALEMNPDQYIWRRRIQQFGPRLDKPYPFYDWIDEARRDIVSRGEQPIPLEIDPSGSEVAGPLKGREEDHPEEKDPDPEGRIQRDVLGLITWETTTVPTNAVPGQPVRVHLAFRPNPNQKAHWNNEAEPLRVWLDPPKEWATSRRLLEAKQPPEPASTEERRLDFEVIVPPTAKYTLEIRGYALYYVCEDEGGVCRYLRYDLSIKIPVAGKATKYGR